ncbi:putative diacylglycerol O-acyltransferase [Mycobacterium tuberculosis]|nr:putative diacylglycerol O-acyltransferase [Mycobacterium tuberculosis]
MRRLNGVDALMLYLDGGSAYNHTLKISVLDPSTDPDGWSWPKARQMFEERAHLLPVFRLRYLPTPLGLHHPIWVEDPEFDLDAHVRRVVCPAPGGMAEFCALVEQIYAHPLDRDRPLWQTWVVEGLDGGRVALVTLLHHAYSDGVGVLDMLAAFYNDTPDEAPVVAPPWEPPPLPSTRQRLGWALRDLPSRLGKIAPTVRAVRDRVRIEREFAKDGDRRVPPTFDRSAPPGPFQRGLSRSRRFSCESFPLAEVREVSKTLGVTINDVFLACVAGAVRRYLERCGSPPTDAMVATMPLAVTPAAERAHPGNYSSVDYVWLRADIADPLERLHATHLAAEATKQHFAQTKDADVGAVVELLPERLISGLARANARTKGRFDTFKNVVVSNVPGPREPRYLGRWRVDQWFSTGQISHGATLNMTVWSYCDQFNLCVMADAVAVRNTWELLGGFRARTRSCSRRPVPKPRPRRWPHDPHQSDRSVLPAAGAGQPAQPHGRLHDLRKAERTEIVVRAAPVRCLPAQPGGQALQSQAEMAGHRCCGVGNRRARHGLSHSTPRPARTGFHAAVPRNGLVPQHRPAR